MLSVVSLFAGIGSADLAFTRAGAPTVAVVEIDAACRGVLALRFPGAEQFGDIQEVTSDQLRAAGFDPARGILVAGFPCQDLSPAGHRAGLGGSRSGLFWHIIRLAGELRPRWVVLENIADLVSAVCGCPGDATCVSAGRALRCGKRIRGRWHDGTAHSVAGGACAGGCMARHGGALGTVIGALAACGYGYSWRVLDAQHAGLAQRRKRCFIVGCLGDGPAAAEVLLEPEGRGGYSPPRRPSRQDVAGTLGTRAGGGGTTDIDRIGAYIPGAVSALGTGNGNGGGWRIGAEEAAGGQLIPFDVAQITHPENRSAARDGDPAPTLNESGGVHVAYPISQDAMRGDGVAVTAQADADGHVRKRDPGLGIGGAGDPAQTVTAAGPGAVAVVGLPSGHGTPLIPAPGEVAIRRLTPRECERLQGLPDDHTRYRAGPRGNVIEQSDSVRYAQIGNAMAVPVVEWIAQRIIRFDERNTP